MLKVVFAKILIAEGGGELEINIEQGLLPARLEQDLAIYLCDVIPNIIDSWPGWKEVEKHLKSKQGTSLSDFTLRRNFH